MSAPYSISKPDATMLLGCHEMSLDTRRAVLNAMLETKGSAAFVDLFAEYISLADAVLASTREFAELYLVIERNEHPHSAEKINLPTMQGALAGALIAVGPTAGMCHGCAFRLGSPANHSNCTTSDALHCIETNFPFSCHADLDDEGNPTSICAGWALATSLAKGAAQ